MSGAIGLPKIFKNELNPKAYANGKSAVEAYWLKHAKQWGNTILRAGSGNHKEKECSGPVDKIFRPMRLFLTVLGRFPFSTATVSPDQGKGRPSFENKMLTFPWAYFLLTSLFVHYVFIICSLGFANFVLEWNFPSKPKYFDVEQKIFHQNLVPFVLFWGCLLQLVVGDLSFLSNRVRIVNYLNNWNSVIEIVQLEVPVSVGRFLFYSNLWIIMFIIAFIIFFMCNIAPIARTACALTANLVLRPFTTGIHHFEEFSSVSVFGLATLLYAIYGARALLFIFMFNSRLLRHSFKIWNERLKEHIFTDWTENEKFNEKAACEKLYKEHYLLVRIVRESSRVFGSILQSYYGIQILHMCFELYYLARSGSGIFYSETSDVVVAGILLVQTVSFFFTVSLGSARVTEEAMKGFEILRSRGLRADDSFNFKHLFYSLEMSYSQRIVLTGGKFFCIDRPFIVTVFGAVFTYFIIILQFRTQMDYESNCSGLNCTCIKN